MADALALGVTYSSVQGRACPLPHGARARPLTTGRALLSSHLARPSLCPTPISPAATKTTRAGVTYGVSRPL